MKIDVTKILGQGGIRVSAGKGSLTNSLKEGDLIKAEVLSNDKGAVTLKAEGGLVFKALAGADMVLSPGDEIQLEVGGKGKGLVLHSVSREDAETRDSVSQSGVATRSSADRSLEPYLNKLAELKMPVSEKTAHMMKELMAQNPGMTLDEAAFLASNKLSGNEALMKAALAMLASGEKTDAMIARLLALLNLPETSGTTPQNPQLPIQNIQQSVQLPVPGGAGLPVELPSNIAETTTTNPGPGNTATTSPNNIQVASQSPMTDWLTLIGAGNSSAPKPPGPLGAAHAPDVQTIITQSDSILQSRILPNVGDIPQNANFSVEKSLLVSQNPLIQTPEQTPRDVQITSPEPLPQDQQTEKPAGTAQNPLPPTPDAQSTLPQGTATSVGRMVTQLLNEVPEFRGTPPQALERFTNMLLRVAGESAETLGGGTDKLPELIDKLFTRIEKGDTDAGMRLKTAREEMYARLTLIEEAISRAEPSSKSGILEQTHRLMEHVRVLNNIDQFAYMQLPVQLGQERKTAELYVFKRKGGKRADPENVNILLALDLENMGRWEALVNFRSKDVSIQMEVRGKAEKEHFSENTRMLHDLLAEVGFKLTGANVTYSEKETTPLTALNSLGKYTGNRPGAIDFWI